MLCLTELWFDCVSFGVYFELFAKMEKRTKSLDVPRAYKISEGVSSSPMLSMLQNDLYHCSYS